MNNAYLYHHGIKGQKWGVRRFQNPDGTLTAAGKKRADNAIVIKAGTTTTRFAGVENIDKRRKYVGQTAHDVDMYRKHAMDGLLYNQTNSVYEYQYSNKADLYIAKGEYVMDKLMNNSSYKDGLKTYYTAVHDSKYSDELRDKAQRYLITVLSAAMSDKNTYNRLAKELKKEGYQGFVDPEDYYRTNADVKGQIGKLYERPMVIMNPKKDLTMKSMKRLK